MSESINRHEFVLFFDVRDGNPNGDPDAGNLPRLDPETSHGLVTDVCLKRKVRNFVALDRGEEPGFGIYMQDGAVLNTKHGEAYEALSIKPEAKKLPADRSKAAELTRWMTRNFFDVRTFGAVMTTEVNCGQVRGPVQLTFARSVDPVVPVEFSITRSSVTNERDREKERTMGRKHTVPYALYRVHGFVSAPLAEQTGFSGEDLDLLWRALANMFEHDRSAARGEMASRRLVVFEHSNRLGNAPAHKLFERVSVQRAGETDAPARRFEDYTIDVNAGDLPDGVRVVEKI